MKIFSPAGPKVSFSADALRVLRLRMRESGLDKPVLCVFRGRPEEHETHKWYLHLRPFEELSPINLQTTDAGVQVWIMVGSFRVEELLIQESDGVLMVVEVEPKPLLAEPSWIGPVVQRLDLYRLLTYLRDMLVIFIFVPLRILFFSSIPTAVGAAAVLASIAFIAQFALASFGVQHSLGIGVATAVGCLAACCLKLGLAFLQFAKAMH